MQVQAPVPERFQEGEPVDEALFAFGGLDERILFCLILDDFALFLDNGHGAQECLPARGPQEVPLRRAGVVPELSTKSHVGAT